MMRAKMKVTRVDKREHAQEVHFDAIPASQPYGNDGLDDNNTYAKFKPSGECQIVIMNPILFGKFEPDQEYYLDFTKAD